MRAYLLALALIAAAPAVAAPKSLTTQPGTWMMRGYGRLFDISGDSVTRYDLTDVSCTRMDTESRVQADQNFFILRSDNAGEITVREIGQVTDYTLVKLASMPNRCRAHSAGIVRDPELNFWVLWHAFLENYAFFDTHAVDWNAVARKFRPRVGPGTSDAQLGDVFNDMLLSLEDGHVTLIAGERNYHSGRPGELRELWAATHPEDSSGRGLRAAADELIEASLSRGKVSSAALGALRWGWLAQGVGYLESRAMWLTDSAHPTGLDVPASLDLIDEGMERALRDLRGARVLVVDARLNGGGHDAIALRIVGHFTRERFRAFDKKAVDGDGFTREQPIFVEPVGRRPYVGTILYLQSGSTVSAAEIFTLAMLARPNVTRIGTPTYGVFSDALEKRLPNGWAVTLSNEIYTAVDGHVYENKGVPPQIAVTIPPGTDFPARIRLDIELASAEAAKLIAKRTSICCGLMRSVLGGRSISARR